MRPTPPILSLAVCLAVTGACAAAAPEALPVFRGPMPEPLLLQRVQPDPARPFDDRLPEDPVAPKKVAHPQPVWGFDVTNDDIAVELDFDLEALGGRVTIDITDAADGHHALLLDAVELDVRTVTNGQGAAVPFDYDGRVLAIPLPGGSRAGTERRYSIRYAARPTAGVYFNSSTAAHPDAPLQAFTQGECEDTRHWMPCHDFPDDVATHAIHVTVPDHMSVSAAGVRTDVEDLPGARRTWHYRMDNAHVTYLTTFVAGEYEITAEDGAVPLEYWVSARDTEHVAYSLRNTQRILEFFGDYTGRPYPYAKYAQCCVREFMFGGMENISATTLTSGTIHPPEWEPSRTSHSLVAHEGAHQWFGDLMTCKHWSHVWLNEGFATYFTHLWREHDGGTDDFLVGMRGTMAGAAGAAVRSRRPVVSDVYAKPFDLFFDGHAYGGGAARLHALRVEVGTEKFKAIVRRYVADHAGGPVTTEDFERSASAAYGADLSWFFDQWFRVPGRPHLKLSWSWDAGTRQVVVRAEQAHDAKDGTPAAYRLPLDVEVDRAGAPTVRRRFALTERSHEFRISLAGPPDTVRFDPARGLLAKVDVERRPDEWDRLLRTAPSTAERLDAIRKISSRLNDKKATEDVKRAARDTLVRIVREDASHHLRLAAVNSLWRPASAENAALLLSVLRDDPDLRVRLRVLERLRAFKESDDVRQELVRRAADPNDLVRAAALTSLSRLKGDGVFDVMVAALDRPGWRGFVRSAALRGLATLGDPRGFDIAAGYAAPGAPPDARAAAVAALGRLGKDREGAVDVVLPFLADARRGLRTQAARSLATLADPSTVPVLVAAHAREPWRGTRGAISRALRAVRNKAVTDRRPVTVLAVQGLLIIGRLETARARADGLKRTLETARFARPEDRQRVERERKAAVAEVKRIENELRAIGVNVPKPKKPAAKKAA